MFVQERWNVYMCTCMLQWCFTCCFVGFSVNMAVTKCWYPLTWLLIYLTYMFRVCALSWCLKWMNSAISASFRIYKMVYVLYVKLVTTRRRPFSVRSIFTMEHALGVIFWKLKINILLFSEYMTCIYMKCTCKSVLMQF